MKVEIIKLSEDEVEIDGMVYKRQTPTLEEMIGAWCRKVNREKTACSDDIAMPRIRSIVFKLPCANKEWTLEVFDYIKETLDHFAGKGFTSSYPEHNHNRGNEITVTIRH